MSVREIKIPCDYVGLKNKIKDEIKLKQTPRNREGMGGCQRGGCLGTG